MQCGCDRSFLVLVTQADIVNATLAAANVTILAEPSTSSVVTQTLLQIQSKLTCSTLMH